MLRQVFLAKDAICNPIVMSVHLSVCLSVIGMRGRRTYWPLRLAAVAAGFSGSATLQAP